MAKAGRNNFFGLKKVQKVASWFSDGRGEYYFEGVNELMVNVKEQKLGKNVRMSFSKTKNVLELPNLVEIQTKSFKWFLEKGLDEVLKDVSPITAFSASSD